MFAKLDPNGSGSVSKQDFISGMTQMMSEIRQQHNNNVPASQAPAPAKTIDASLSALNDLALGSNINTIA